MPIRSIPGTKDSYYLVCFDANGTERKEPEGSFLTERLLKEATTTPVTDVFFLSHGWKGDVPAAIEQYDAWLGAVGGLTADLAAVRTAVPDFAPLTIGLHWPSQPWGDENLNGSGLLSIGAGSESQSSAEAFAGLATSDTARELIHEIVRQADAARQDDIAQTLRDIKPLYARLFEALDLASHSESMKPGADQEGLSVESIYAATPSVGTAQDGLLGSGENFKDFVLSPLRQLSFWKMKDRARRFGETSAHDLLVQLQKMLPGARFHLMGHSFGCIVVSSTIRGADGSSGPARAVDSLFLVQGALSLWSFAKSIPYGQQSGFYRDVLAKGLVKGPIITTRSRFDSAVGRYYPMGAQVATQYLLDVDFPKYGAIGAFGIQGAEIEYRDFPIGSAGEVYVFFRGGVFNAEASSVIRNGSGLSGAHSDIVHPEVAHLFWCGVLTGLTPQSMTGPGGSSGLLSLDLRPEPIHAIADRNDSLDWGLAPPELNDEIDSLASLRRAGPTRGLTHRSPDEFSLELAPVRVDDASSSLGGREGPGLLDSGDHPLDPPATETWLHHELEDIAAGSALKVGKWYTLAFYFDPEKPQDGTTDVQPIDPRDLLTEDTATLRVQLESSSFAIANQVLPIKLCRDGRSTERTRFGISPLMEGDGSIVATLHKDGNFVTRLVIAYRVGGVDSPQPKAVQSSPATPQMVPVVARQPRDFSIYISAAGTNYDCVVSGVVASSARLTCTRDLVSASADRIKDALLALVTTPAAKGGLDYQKGLQVEIVDSERALKQLAIAGEALFRTLFFGPAAGLDSISLGDYLRKQATDPNAELELQIIGHALPIPWSLLYLGDLQQPLSWEFFLGYRHIVEQIPLQTGLFVSDPTITTQPSFTISANVNTSIDVAMKATYVKDQVEFWKDLSNKVTSVQFSCRENGSTFLSAALDRGTADKLMYFFCHAKSADLKAGPDSSSLVFKDGAVTLGQLSQRNQLTPFSGAPLVLINACESADLSPLFYEGFVPYFASRGARGVIGTECKVPAVFAADWARRFFAGILAGESVGRVARDLRRDYLAQCNNHLAFLYAVHCNADTRMNPAIA
jgi:hypothetical protein